MRLPYPLKNSSATWFWCLSVAALTVHFQCLSVLGFHCHRKHDHSADILLQGDSSEHYIQGDTGHAAAVAASSSNSFYTAKLVQEKPSKFETKRDLVDDKFTSQDPFCPNLTGCTCNVTTGTNRLQVTCTGRFMQKFPVEQLRHDVEVLIIQPFNSCPSPDLDNFCGHKNSLTMGPKMKILRQLKTLRIQHSRVPNIGRKTLWGLSGLEILDLSHNALTNVIEPNFDGLYSLRELYLNHNQIKSIVSAAFRHASRLQILSLAHNRLEGLAPRVFYKLQELKMLDLSNNRIQFIDGATFVDIPDIEVFKCDNCQLFQLRTPDFVIPEKLHTISLAQNVIQDLSEIHPNLLRIVRNLNLSGNQIREVLFRKHFGNSNLLQNLDLSHNNLSAIEDCAFCNTSLDKLNLGYNGLRSVNPDMVHYDIRSLHSLTLSGNWLSVENIEVLVSKMPNLQELNIDETGIATLPPGLFYNNLKLKELNISANYLIHLDASVISNLDMLEVLDLSNNYFMGLDQVFFDVLNRKQKPRLKMVYLQGNQFVCDQCHIGPLLKWLRSSLQYWGTCLKRSNSLCLKCSQPNEYLHMPLEDLNMTSLPECQEVKHAVPFNDIANSNPEWESMMKEKSHISSYIAGGFVSLLLLIVLTIALLRYRHYGVYVTHEEDQLVDGDDVLRNPVIVLDKNSESYINLKYPIHSKEDTELTKGLAPKHKC